MNTRIKISSLIIITPNIIKNNCIKLNKKKRKNFIILTDKTYIFHQSLSYLIMLNDIKTILSRFKFKEYSTVFNCIITNRKEK